MMVEPNSEVLPIPDRRFGGSAGRTLDQSVPDWWMIAYPQAPEGAPNVLVVLIDDAGFGGPAPFDGGIDTPTWAAMLNGRNHHRVGFGSIAEYPGPFGGAS